MGGSKRKRHRARRAAAGRAVPPPPPWEELLRPFIRFAGPIAILVTGVAMLAWTWRTWPDPLVDYGREAYHAWQVTRGKTLYVDLAHFSGPLSVYVNALFLRIFGTSILTLALTNAVLTGGCVAMLYSLLVRVADRLAATLAGVTFVAIFAFGRFVPLGNYNWLCPYAYELPHGVMLAVAGFWFLDRYHRTRRLGWLTATGAALGLVALTKTEALFAAAIAGAVGLALTVVAGNLRKLAVATWWYAVFFAPGVAAAIFLRGARRWAAATVVVVLASMAAAARFVPIDGWIQNAARPLPLFLLLITVGSIVAYLRSRTDPDAAPRYALQTSLAVFALALLAKMVLNARLYAYGFALGMPATLVLIAALVTWAPKILTHAGLQGRALRACAVGLLLV